MEILYDYGLDVLSINDYIIEGNNYIFNVYYNDIQIDIIVNIIDKKITIFENDKLTYHLCCEIYNPNLVY
jgi:hypothetical protein